MDKTGWKGCIIWRIFDKNFYLYGNTLICISIRFFENQPNEICSHLCEKASKGMFLKLEKLQNHNNEEKGKEKKKERGKGKEEKKKNRWLHS